MKSENVLFNWKKLIVFIVLLFILLLIIYFIYLYKFIEESKVINGDETERFVLRSTSLISVDKLYHFQVNELYHILMGNDEIENEMFVFVPLQENLSKEYILVFTSKDFLTKEQIENNWLQDCESCQLHQASPAMINKKPLWELTYTDHSNRYVIAYYSMEDGSIYEQLRLVSKSSKREVE